MNDRGAPARLRELAAAGADLATRVHAEPSPRWPDRASRHVEQVCEPGSVGGGWKSSKAAAFRRSVAHDHPGPGSPGPDSPSSIAPPQPVDDTPATQDTPDGYGRVRAGGAHCWVLMPDADPLPGIVAAWRRDATGEWQARVAYALGDTETASVVTGWVPAPLLRPAGGSRS